MTQSPKKTELPDRFQTLPVIITVKNLEQLQPAGYIERETEKQLVAAWVQASRTRHNPNDTTYFLTLYTATRPLGEQHGLPRIILASAMAIDWVLCGNPRIFQNSNIPILNGQDLGKQDKPSFYFSLEQTFTKMAAVEKALSQKRHPLTQGPDIEHPHYTHAKKLAKNLGLIPQQG